MDSDKLINRLLDILNELVKRNYLMVRSNELLEILKMIEKCTDCKDNIMEDYFDEFYKLTKRIEKEGEEETNDMIHKLNDVE